MQKVIRCNKICNFPTNLPDINMCSMEVDELQVHISEQLADGVDRGNQKCMFRLVVVVGQILPRAPNTVF